MFQQVEHDLLSLEDVARIVGPGLENALGAVCPEAIQMGAQPSTFDAD